MLPTGDSEALGLLHQDHMDDNFIDYGFQFSKNTKEVREMPLDYPHWENPYLHLVGESGQHCRWLM